jgi:hypothetical protein
MHWPSPCHPITDNSLVIDNASEDLNLTVGPAGSLTGAERPCLALGPSHTPAQQGKPASADVQSRPKNRMIYRQRRTARHPSKAHPVPRSSPQSFRPLVRYPPPRSRPLGSPSVEGVMWVARRRLMFSGGCLLVPTLSLTIAPGTSLCLSLTRTKKDVSTSLQRRDLDLLSARGARPASSGESGGAMTRRLRHRPAPFPPPLARELTRLRRRALVLTTTVWTFPGC